MVIVGDIVGGVMEVRNVEWVGKRRTKRDGAGWSTSELQLDIYLRLASLIRFNNVRNNPSAVDDE